eukprot:558532-Prorocentrum_minimum.AAC.3
MRGEGSLRGAKEVPDGVPVGGVDVLNASEAHLKLRDMTAIQCLSWFEPFGAALARADEQALEVDGFGTGAPNQEHSYFLFSGVDDAAPDHDEEVYICGTRCVRYSSGAQLFMRPKLLFVRMSTLTPSGRNAHTLDCISSCGTDYVGGRNVERKSSGAKAVYFAHHIVGPSGEREP